MSKEKRIYLKDLHSEHKEWLNELQLYDEEMASFELRLEEVVAKNTDKELLAELEQLQNSIFRHKDVIDVIVHHINGHEKELADFAEKNQVAIDRKYFDDHPKLRDEIETERKLFSELKANVQDFLAKSM